jgi:Zn-dependent protease
LPIPLPGSTISLRADILFRGLAAVLLLEPEPTPFDLHFRLFRTPVRVHPMFWALSALLGWEYSKFGLGYLVLWVLCVFVSILIHEFGHVWAGRLFGAEGYIVLFSFGGLAIGSSDLRVRWQRVLVYFAGPLIQLLLAAIIWWGVRPLAWDRVPPDWRVPVREAIVILLEINVFWPVINLLPIWPLDGGKIAREVCEALLGRRGVAVSLGISLVVSGLLALHTFLAEKGRGLIPYVPPLGMYMALFFLLFCVSSFLALQAENERFRRQGGDDWR